MNTTENNKTIAEFVEWKFKEKFNCYVIPFNYVDYLDDKPFINKICHVDNLQFHSDWNWLMEVVEKIETEFPNYTIQWEYDAREEFSEEGKYKAYLFTLFPRDEILRYLTDARSKTRIEAVYNACVEFIKWYNENK